ncbi:ATP-binding protein [Alteriqipengyuania lutimaris]|nr:ATP-binding protein [Alteriqipengyuania lutimaris]MBB3033358.1 signal transduction histidine kinase [Alteriqipengyuania lutimaris]
MQRIVAGNSFSRRPSRRELLIFAFLAIFIVAVEPFEPYDWLQRSVTAAANPKAYRGDAVIVAIDTDTVQQQPTNSWTKSDLADLLAIIGNAQPKQILVDSQYFAEDTDEGAEQLAEAVAELPLRPVWRIDLTPEEVGQLSRSSAPPAVGKLAETSSRLEPEIAGRVTPSVMALREHTFGAPVYAPVAVRMEDGLFPSLATLLAEGSHGVALNAFNVDLRYDPATVPAIPAGDLLAGDFDPKLLEGKRVLISFVDVPSRDTLVTPLDPYTSRAAATILAAQTLRDGPPVSIGWLPSFALAFMAALIWLFIRRPYGRVVALAAMLVIAVSPLFLEPHLIFLQTSHAIFLLLLLALTRLWTRGADAVRTYRSAAESKSRFLAQASHDLRQPIHAIGLLAERLADTDLSRDQQLMVSKISWSVENASRMFRALLDIAAIESGTLKVRNAPVAVNDLLADLDRQNALTAEQASVELRFVPSDLHIHTDRALIGTILQNLVSNAIKYAPGKKVLVGCRRHAGKVTLAVIDNGRGISADELLHVRKEFYRIASRGERHSDNKGLGLAIVNRISEMLGLRFVLRSKEGRGTAATIEGLAITDLRETGTAPPSIRPMPLSGVRIVLIEDDVETRISTQRLLERWGCQVEAYDTLPESIPNCDILLSDYDLSDGRTLAKWSGLVSHLHDAGSILIVISGHHPEKIRVTLPEHAGLILSKPLRAAELRSALMSVRR